MLVLAALENWYITGLNVRSAYLYSKLDEKIYMKQPEGFAVPRQERKVLRLWCALYGLKQAGLAWWRTLDESLKELRFEHLKSEAGIFFYKKKGTNIVIGIVTTMSNSGSYPVTPVASQLCSSTPATRHLLRS